MGDESGITKAPEGAGDLAPRLGAAELANLPEEEFQQRLKALQLSQSRVRQIKAGLMRDGVHFGTIPNTDKPTLLKPGGEVLCQVYNLRPDYIVETSHGDGETSPPISITVRCLMHVGDTKGPIVGVGLGAANSWERRHRYRKGERACPQCGVIGSVIKGKAEFGGGWVCWKRKKGCGANFSIDDPAITSQAVDDLPNPDPFDLQNTLLKMGKKRAFLDGVLTATGSSDIFTQDLDEDAPQGKGQPPAGSGPTDQPTSEGDPPSSSDSCPFCGSADFVVSQDGKTAVCAQRECARGWNLGRK